MNTQQEVDRMTNEGGPDVPLDPGSRFDRLKTYAREHRRLSVLGVAAILFGAGIAVLVVKRLS